MLKLFIFSLLIKIGPTYELGNAWRTTKLIEGGHRGLQAYRPICYYFYVFLRFLRFFFKIQKTWLFTFFVVFHTFSRTMNTTTTQLQFTRISVVYCSCVALVRTLAIQRCNTSFLDTTCRKLAGYHKPVRKYVNEQNCCSQSALHAAWPTCGSCKKTCIAVVLHLCGPL